MSKNDDEQETPLFPKHEIATKKAIDTALRAALGELKISSVVVYLPYNSTPNEVQELVKKTVVECEDGIALTLQK